MPDGYFPPKLARSAERVAREGYDGLMRNKRVVVPGFDNQVVALLPRLMSRQSMLSLIARYRSSRKA